MAAAVANGLSQKFVFRGVFLELSVDLELKQFWSLVVGVEKERS